MNFNFFIEQPEKSIDYFALVSFIVSIVLSIISLIISTKVSNRTKRQTLNAAYFTKIFDTYLIYKFPVALEKIIYRQSEFTDESDGMENAIAELYSNIKLFKYKDLSFYKKMEDKIIEIDDYLVNHKGVQCSQAEFDDWKNNIEIEVRKLYHLVEVEYCK